MTPRRQSVAVSVLAVTVGALLVVSLCVAPPRRDICLGLALVAGAFVALLGLGMPRG